MKAHGLSKGLGFPAIDLNKMSFELALFAVRLNNILNFADKNNNNFSDEDQSHFYRVVMGKTDLVLNQSNEVASRQVGNSAKKS